MKTKALRSSIWLTNFILVSLAATLYLLFSTYYYAYAFNSFFKIEFLDIGVNCDIPMWLINVKITLLAFTSLIGIYVFWLIRKMLIGISKEGPFIDDVVSKLKSILSWTILFVLLKFLSGFLIDLYVGDHQIVFDSSTLIILFLIGIVYVLIEVFRHGVVLQEDQKLTI